MNLYRIHNYSTNSTSEINNNKVFLIIILSIAKNSCFFFAFYSCHMPITCGKFSSLILIKNLVNR